MSTRLRLPMMVRQLMAAQLAKPANSTHAKRSRRACLYKVDRIGDFVLALGALRALIKFYGASECRLVVSSLAAPLAAAEFPDVSRWELPPDANGVWRDIRPLRREHAPLWGTENFEELVCLRHACSIYRDITLGWVDARRWQGLGERPAPAKLFVGHRPQLAASYPPATEVPWCRELLAHRTVVAQVTGVVSDWETLRPRLQNVRARAGDAWVFCPFGSEPNRDYPEDRWIEAWRSAGLPAGPVHVIGAQARAKDLARLAERLRREAGRTQVEVAVSLPPMEFIGRLAQARGIVTVESAAAHFATALDKPALVVMGGGHFGWFAPWGSGGRQRWLTKEMPCFNCGWQCQFSSVRCLVEQPPETVAAALRDLMSHA